MLSLIMATGYSQKELIRFNFESLNLDSNDFFGNSPPAVFVGRFGYPKVNVGVLSPVERKDQRQGTCGRPIDHQPTRSFFTGLRGKHTAAIHGRFPRKAIIDPSFTAGPRNDEHLSSHACSLRGCFGRIGARNRPGRTPLFRSRNW